MDGIDLGTPIMVLPSGAHTLTVDGVGDSTGAYQFRLVNLESATPIAQNVSTVGELNPASETDLYRFGAVAGDRFLFDVTDRNGAANAT